MKNTKRLLAIILMVTLLMTLFIGAAPAYAKSKAKTVKTTKITLSEKGTVKLNKGDSITLTATLKPSNSTQAVKWSTSDKKVATVSSKGVVKAKKAGKATITAKSGSKSKSVKIKVTDPTIPTGISLDYTKTVKLPKNQKLKITATLAPAMAKGTVKWSSSSKSIATVSSKGVVTPKKKGIVTITAKCNKLKATVKIKVVSASSTPVATPAPIATPEPEAHAHTWVDVTTTVEHPEEGHYEVQNTKVQTGTTTTYVNHPAEGHYEEVSSQQMVKEAWDEDVTVIDVPEWSEVVGHAICNACGQEITDHSQLNYTSHIGCPQSKVRYLDYPDTPENQGTHVWEGTNGAGVTQEIVERWTADDSTPWVKIKQTGGGLGSLNIINETVVHPAETHVEVVHHDAEYKTVTDKVWVEDKAAWTEEVVTPTYKYESKNVWVVDKAAWAETVVTGQKCSGCGATK